MQENILFIILFSISALTAIRILPIHWRKYGLFLSNMTFYFFCDKKFLFLLLLGIFWSFLVSRKINDINAHKLIWLWIGIIPVLLILCIFKYYRFFIPKNAIFLSLAMPLGISYYTFKIISYLADVYRDKCLVSNSLVDYSIYISFFPQIICGPIARFNEFNNYQNHLAQPSQKFFNQGCYLILSGLFKKLVIADRLSSYVTTIFSNYTAYPPLALWLAAFFFTVQIYCDFSGYSEIAIGITNLFGIECRFNFNKPYFAYSINDFWKKWHISLSSWLQDYIYIPLGGNRKGIFQKNLNIIITFFISGIWHGTGLNFICWGLWHGILSIFSFSKLRSKCGHFLQILFTFFLVMLGWILFRSDSLTTSICYIAGMCKPCPLNTATLIASIMPLTGDYSCLSHFITISIFIFILFIMELNDYKRTISCAVNISRKRVVVFIISIIFFGMIGQNSFLYANF